jgi:hypothetical protein
MLSKSTLGGKGIIGKRKSRGNHMKASNHSHKSIGMGLRNEIFEDGKLKKASELLRTLNIKPKIPRKYISFD